MNATNFNKPAGKLRNLIMMIRLHRRFSAKAIPVMVEKRMNVPDAYRKRF